MIGCLISVIIVGIILVILEQIVEYILIWAGLTLPIQLIRLLFALIWLLYLLGCLFNLGIWMPIRMR